MLATGPLVGSHGRFRSAAPLLALVFLLTAVSFPQLKGAVLLACLALPPSCLPSPPIENGRNNHSVRYMLA